MERTDEPRLQLLFESKDPIQMKGLTAILCAHGIHTVREPTSLPWRSIGIDSLCMVAASGLFERLSALRRLRTRE
jgi:hypothetical protein